MENNDSRIDYALATLSKYLVEGPKTYKAVKRYCKQHGITRGELHEAKKLAGVKTTPKNGTWYWSEEVDKNAGIND